MYQSIGLILTGPHELVLSESQCVTPDPERDLNVIDTRVDAEFSPKDQKVGVEPLRPRHAVTGRDGRSPAVFGLTVMRAQWSQTWSCCRPAGPG
jgi:hypothetical protein